MTPAIYSTVRGTTGRHVRGAHQQTIHPGATEITFGRDYAAGPNAGAALVVQCVERSIYNTADDGTVFPIAGVDWTAVRRQYVEQYAVAMAAGCPFVAIDAEGAFTHEQWAAIDYVAYSSADEAGLAWGNYEQWPILKADAAVLPRHFGGWPVAQAKDSRAPLMLHAVSLHPGAAANPALGKLAITTPARRVAMHVAEAAAMQLAGPGKTYIPWMGDLSNADPGDASVKRPAATNDEITVAAMHLLLRSKLTALVFSQSNLSPQHGPQAVAAIDLAVDAILAALSGRTIVRTKPYGISVAAKTYSTTVLLDDGTMLSLTTTGLKSTFKAA